MFPFFLSLKSHIGKEGREKEAEIEEREEGRGEDKMENKCASFREQFRGRVSLMWRGIW